MTDPVAEFVITLDGKIKFRCPLCPLVREYGTKPGALTRAAEHLLASHNKRLVAPE